MTTRIDLIFSNGVFRPVEPITMPENHRMSAILEDVNARKKNIVNDLPPVLKGEEWHKQFNELIQAAKDRAGRYPEGFEADISRDAMYPDE
jgi:predicted DNA-binding antitoxin AbrB/MazE fold protein